MALKEFKSKDTDFSSRATMLYVRFLGLALVAGLAISVIVYSGIEKHYIRKNADLDYSDMSLIPGIVIMSIFLVGMMIRILFWRGHYENQEVIIGIQFNDEAKKLTVHTKTLRGDGFRRVFRYDEIRTEANRLCDGMDTAAYDTLTLVQGSRWKGHIFKDHFTWTPSVVDAIKAELLTLSRKK